MDNRGKAQNSFFLSIICGMSLKPGFTRRIYVRDGRAKCHRCGQRVSFLTDQRLLKEHKGKRGDQWCRPSYAGVVFVLPDGAQLTSPYNGQPRQEAAAVVKSRMSRAEQAHQHAPQQYTPYQPSQLRNEQGKLASRKSGKRRRRRRGNDAMDYALLGGLPSTNRSRY